LLTEKAEALREEAEELSSAPKQTKDSTAVVAEKS
jgi:hypothetical protein